MFVFYISFFPCMNIHVSKCVCIAISMMMSHTGLGLVVMTSYLFCRLFRFVRHTPPQTKQSPQQQHTHARTHAQRRIIHANIDGPNVRTNVIPTE
jgi:cytochrome b561